MSDFDLMISIAKRLNDDRVSLRAENERLRAENEQLRGALGLRDALRHAAWQEKIKHAMEVKP